MSKSIKYTIQEEIGKHFLDRASQLLKEGKKCVFVLDNIDWDVKAHDMQSDQQNESVHAVAASIAFDHISFPCLPIDGGPPKQLSDYDL